MFNLVPPQYVLAAKIIFILLVAGNSWLYGRHQVYNEWKQETIKIALESSELLQKAKQKIIDQQNKNIELNHQIEVNIQNHNLEIQSLYEKNTKSVSNVLASVRLRTCNKSTTDRLSSDSSSSRISAELQSTEDWATLEEIIGLVPEVTREADELGTQVEGWQNWYSRIKR